MGENQHEMEQISLPVMVHLPKIQSSCQCYMNKIYVTQTKHIHIDAGHSVDLVKINNPEAHSLGQNNISILRMKRSGKFYPTLVTGEGPALTFYPSTR